MCGYDSWLTEPGESRERGHPVVQPLSRRSRRPPLRRPPRFLRRSGGGLQLPLHPALQSRLGRRLRPTGPSARRRVHWMPVATRGAPDRITFSRWKSRRRQRRNQRGPSQLDRKTGFILLLLPRVVAPALRIWHVVLSSRLVLLCAGVGGGKRRVLRDRSRHEHYMDRRPDERTRQPVCLDLRIGSQTFPNNASFSRRSRGGGIDGLPPRLSTHST